MKSIIVSVIVNATKAQVWECWTGPEHIVKWNAASDDWHTPKAENDMRIGGRFKSRMEARDGSAGFDFTGAYTHIRKHEFIEYIMDDGRNVKVEFLQVPGGIKIIEAFEPEQENPEELQRAGWQAILDNFKRYAERTVPAERRDA